MKRSPPNRPRLPKPTKRGVAPVGLKATIGTAEKRSYGRGADSEKVEIGFKKPPKAYSWPRGQSGNPRGRKKGSKNKKTIIIRLMEGRLGRKIPDPRKLSAQEALLWKAIQKGLAGDAKSMAFAFKRYDDATSSSWTGQVITTEEDQQVYDALRAKVRHEIEEEDHGNS
jgi:hypothetical protein